MLLLGLEAGRQQVVDALVLLQPLLHLDDLHHAVDHQLHELAL